MRRDGPRLALGFAKSRLDADDGGETEQKSLLARLAIRRGIELEVELAEMKLMGADARTAGVSVLRVFGRGVLHPYLIAGFGGGTIDTPVPRADDPRVHYAELGGGLMIRRRHLAIGADLRRGMRSIDNLYHPATTTVPPAPATAGVPRMTTPPAPEEAGDPDRYTRGRITVLFYF
ncbi:MAG: hypothetical protein KF773_41105 [Deltaproteobacteria bacterium]|nr:hypothetical protein [Deltaproteobacteria bacterium]